MSSLLDTSVVGFDAIGELLASATIFTNDILRKDLHNLVGVTELVVPEGVKALDCCLGTTRIRRIVLPRSLDCIRLGAFDGAADLEEVVFTRGCMIPDLKYSTFSRCYSLRKLDLSPTKIRTIDARCFDGSGLEEIILPKALSYLTYDAFRSCQNLRKVVFRGRRLKTIQNGSFQDCTSLEEIELPDTVSNIYDRAFKGCRNLRRVVATGCKNIGSEAFGGAPDIEVLDLPKVFSYYDSSFEPGVVERARPKIKTSPTGVHTCFDGIQTQYTIDDTGKAYQEGGVSKLMSGKV